MQLVSKSLKMSKKIAKWRDSASIIILSRDKESSTNVCNYKVLLFNRSANASFMPTTAVFPGGMCEDEDGSLQWLNHFKNMGIPVRQLQMLILKRDSGMKYLPDIFQSRMTDQLSRDISLRITAIRETFEEMGILLCRDPKSLENNKSHFGSYRENFDRKYWQHLVHNDASQFLNLCKELKVVPDLWSLHEWSVWLTPAVFKKRFQTAFYLVALPDIPDVILEQNEGTDYKWISPKDALIANVNDQIFLGPPQLYELSRLLNFNKLKELEKFARRRASNGTVLFLPVQRLCTDGMIALLPGDSDYPQNPNASDILESIEITKEQYRSRATRLHRHEFEKPNFGIFYMNFEPTDGHFKPINVTLDYKL